MTQPDELLPDTSANYSSLAAHAAKPQEDWEDELTTAEVNRWGDAGVLGGLFLGLTQGKPFVVALIEAIVHEVFEGLTDVYTTAEDAFEGLASNFSGKWRDIINAQDSADYALAQLAAMNRSIVDLFDEAAGVLSANWDTQFYGSGGGSIRQDGNGNAWWNSGGGVARGEWCRWNADTTATDYQNIVVTMPLPVQASSGSVDESRSYMMGRVNNTSTIESFVYAKIARAYVEIGCYVSGSVTVFDTQAITPRSGNTWEFALGTLDDEYEFVLICNGIETLRVTDGSHVSQVGAGYRSVGFGMFAADRNLFTAQTSPGTMAVFSADDPPWGS